MPILKGVFTSQARCERLDRALEEAIQGHWLRRGLAPPVELVEHYAEVREGAALFRAEIAMAAKRQVGGISGDMIADDGANAGPSGEGGMWLTAREAAARARLTDRHIRHLCQKRTVKAERTAAGTWRVDAVALAEFVESREESRRKA